MDLCGGGGYGTEHVLCEILKRLPVKSLFRFRCVSKPWNDFISDPFFVTSHLRFNKSSSSSNTVLGITINVDQSNEQLPQFEYFRIDNTNKTTLEHLKIPFPWNFKPPPATSPMEYGKPYVTILGHCNGLVCALHSLMCYGEDQRFAWERFILSNPITGSFLVLPESAVHVPDLTFEHDPVYRDEEWVYTKAIAIGFSFVDDLAYKVVRVTYGMVRWHFDMEYGYTAYEQPWIEVYDSRSFSWRRVSGFDFDFPYEYLYGGVYMLPVHGYENDYFDYKYLRGGAYNPLDGCLYWLGKGRGRDHLTILSFDLVKETMHQTMVDGDVFGEYGRCLGVEIMLGHSVAMLVGDRRNKLVFSVWKMNREQDHNEVSWTHMYRFNSGGFPRGFCRDGELLLIMHHSYATAVVMKLLLYDWNKVEDGSCGFRDLGFKVHSAVPDFVESLVLLEGKTSLEEEACLEEEDLGHPPRLFEEEARLEEEEEEDLRDLPRLFEENL